MKRKSTLSASLGGASMKGKGNYDYLIHNDSQKISYTKLKAHIDTMHPRKEDPVSKKLEVFSVCDDVGAGNWCPCCHAVDEDGDKLIKITHLDEQVGLGTTLFLQKARALMLLFLLLTILNIPVLLFYFT